MIAAGIDLGGTKIEVQIFDADWQIAARQRVPTPQDYDQLVDAIKDQVEWAEVQAGSPIPVGIGAAGLVNRATGLALTANLCASGRPLPADVDAAVGRHVTYVNDCRALALSEAVFGAGKGRRSVMSLILGTGVGGGLVIDRKLETGHAQTAGEYGHVTASAHLVSEYGLPVLECGCGRMGCIETLISGPGLTRIAQALTGKTLMPKQVADRRKVDDDARRVWDVWGAMTADLLRTLTLTIDPDIVVLGGGMSQIEGVAEALQTALADAQIGDFPVAAIVTAQGGDTSGARGAAYAATLDFQHG